jgi:hypothetical protein
MLAAEIKVVSEPLDIMTPMVGGDRLLFKDGQKSGGDVLRDKEHGKISNHLISIKNWDVFQLKKQIISIRFGNYSQLLKFDMREKPVKFEKTY